MSLLVLIFLHNGLFPIAGSQVLSSQYTDGRSEFYPNQSFGFGALSEGIIPLWNPYVFSGMPYFATIKNGIFYPLNFLYLILPVGSAINWTIALHMLLSGVTMYYLLKHYGTGRFGATIAGIVYTYSAPHIMHIYPGHPNLLATTAWMPLAFLFLDRLIRGEGVKYGFWLSIIIALELLAGYPQHLLYILLALSFYLLFSLTWLRSDGCGWKEIGSKGLAFAGFIALGLALSAVQILPTVEMTKYSTRENLSYEWVSIFSFPPENLITFLIPDFFGDMLKIPYWAKNYLWEMSVYVGIMPLILAGIALFYCRSRFVWFFATLAIASLILALGKYTPLLKLFYNYVPGFHQFRGHSKFIILTALSLSVLSGIGADAVIKRAYGLDKRFMVGVVGLGIFLIVALFVMYAAFGDIWFRGAINSVVSSGDLYNNPAPFMQKGFEVAATASFRDGILWTAALLVSGTTVLLLYLSDKLRENVFMLLLAFIIVLDLFTFGMRYMVTFDGSEARWNRDIESFLKRDREPFRAIAPEMEVNSGTASGIETLGGYDAIMVKRYSEFINFSQGLAPDATNPWVSIKSVNRLTDLLNAKYLVLDSGQEMIDPAFNVVFDNERYRVYQNPNALPRAVIVHKTEVIRDRDAIFRELISPEFDPTTSAIIEEDLDIQLSKPFGKNPVPKVHEHSPNKVTIEAYLAQPGLLVLGDTYYPGWKAFVDGKESKIYPTNYVMRGVVLPEGRHIVEFRYEPLSFKIGAVITLLSLVFIVGFFVWGLRKKRRPCIS